MKTNRIKNIIFDLGGVILNIDYNKTADAFKKLGLVNFDEIYSQFCQNNLFDDLEKGLIKPGKFITELQSHTSNKPREKQLIAAWNAMLLNLPEIRIKLLQKVNENYRVFLLSNTNIIHYEYYINYFETTYQLDFNSLFEKAYYSHEIGLRKPDKECFEFVLQNSNLLPSDTLFIDDSIQHIKSATTLKINTIHHTEGCITDLFSKEGNLLNFLA